MAYVRGSQVQFISLPDMLGKAPYFNRIKLWRKFKGNAVFGGGAFINKAGMLIRPGTRPPAVAMGVGPGPGPGQFAPGIGMRENVPRGGPAPYGAPRPMGGYGGPGPSYGPGMGQSSSYNGSGGPRGPPYTGYSGGPPPQQQQYQQYRS